MKNKLATFNLAWASLSLATTGLVGQSPATLTIHTAIEVEYPTEIGKIYTLQGTTDFETWVDIGSSYLPGEIIAGHVRVHRDRRPT